jgi:hypothetical protein
LKMFPRSFRLLGFEPQSHQRVVEPETNNNRILGAVQSLRRSSVLTASKAPL